MESQQSVTSKTGADFTNPIQGDWRCIACEYPLIGLDPLGACPECGTRLALSLRDDCLSHANPLWVIRLAQGTTLLFFAWTINLICEVPFYFMRGLPPPSSIIRMTDRLLSGLHGLFWLAYWLIASAEYVAAGEYRSRRWCWAIRILIVTSIATWITISGTTYSSVMWIGYSCQRMALTIVVWLYLRMLVRRIPDHALLQQIPFAIAGFTLVEFIDYTLFPLNYLNHYRLPSIPQNVQGLITIAIDVFGVYLLARLSNQFTACANHSMENYLSEKSDANLQCVATSGASTRVNDEP